MRIGFGMVGLVTILFGRWLFLLGVRRSHWVVGSDHCQWYDRWGLGPLFLLVRVS